MKVIVDARVMSCRPSGIGIYLYDFLKELIFHKEFTFMLVTDVVESDQIRYFEAAGIPILQYGTRIFRTTKVLSYFSFVNRILVKEQPDIFWEPNIIIPITLKGYRGRTVVTIHDIFPLTVPQFYSKLYQMYFKNGLKNTLRQVDAVLFVSEETKRQSEKIFHELLHKKTFVSYLIVTRPPVKPITAGNYFLYIGNLEFRKGTDILLNAYRCYKANGGDRPLYLAGNIRDKKIHQMLIRLQKEYDTVHYVGYVREKEKYELLANCSAFLFPSRAEGFGIPPLEAISYQKPVISSDLSIFREILKVPASTFKINADTQEQITQLCTLLEQEPKPYSKEDCDAVLDCYRADVLGERLSRFLYEL